MSGEKPSAGDRASALLVGTSARDARLLSCGFEREGVSVDVAPDVRTAIDRLAAVSRAEAALPGLVVLDFTADPADSLTVLKAVRASPRLGTLPTVALVNHTVTDAEAEERVQSAYECGVNGHVFGPDDIEAYVDASQEMAAFWFDTVSLPPKSLYFDGTSIEYE